MSMRVTLDYVQDNIREEYRRTTSKEARKPLLRLFKWAQERPEHLKHCFKCLAYMGSDSVCQECGGNVKLTK